MPHTYECPLRWADMDLLGHVNNVTYLDYVAEARQALLRDAGVDRVATAPVASHQVEFAAPLVFRRRPVLVDSWVVEAGKETLTLAHEIYDTGEDGDAPRRVYLRASSVLRVATTDAERESLAPLRGPGPSWRPVAADAPAAPGAGSDYRAHVRVADLGEDGHVRDVLFFEYFQEARIRYFMDLHTRGQEWSQHVVARTDVDLRAPATHRSAPYVVHSRVGHVGTTSFTILAEMRDGDQVLATARVVMVTFEAQSQRPVPMNAAQRERLLRELSGTAAG